eukprot:CAMPEP_0204405118 /NCGR_PEP_ID=MMETSP0470-20130426/7128_1 /ASSEMBLY_ACC=CAM_ASM_000385 /TAXON_ID=2969 /ORGANISM="Oxyrrhis marina" /LENGTH=52 /DNA_ID=CAMNT_0051400513 /DNA_START=55 /DNA_END=210 /DNA_ORIENTATION=-
MGGVLLQMSEEPGLTGKLRGAMGTGDPHLLLERLLWGRLRRGACTAFCLLLF